MIRVFPSRVLAWCLLLLAPVCGQAANEKFVWGGTVRQIEGGGGFSFAETIDNGVDVNAVGAPPDGSTVYIRREFKVTSTLAPGSRVLADLLVELQGESSVEIRSGGVAIEGGGPFISLGMNVVLFLEVLCLEVGRSYDLIAEADMPTPDFSEAYAIASFTGPRLAAIDLVANPLTWDSSGNLKLLVTATGDLRCQDMARARLFWASGATKADVMGSPIFDRNFSIGPGGTGVNRLEESFSCPFFNGRPAGATHLVLVVDPDALLPETNEGNNVAVVQVPLRLPNPIADFSVNEDSTDTGINLRNTFQDFRTPDADLLFSIVANSNLGLVQARADNGADVLFLDYQPDQTGSATITVRAMNECGFVRDDTFVVTVRPVNDPPCGTFSRDPVVVVVNSGPQSIARFAGFVPGAVNEASQTLVGYTVTNDKNSLFSAQPRIRNDGTLTFTPSTTLKGSARVTVVAQDNGGVPNGGMDKCTRIFMITVVATAPNSCPVVESVIPDFLLFEDATNSVVDLRFVFKDAETADDKLLYSVQANSNPVLAAAAVDPANRLILSYPTNQNGSATITVRATDGGGCWVEDVFTVTLQAVNDAPDLVLGGNVLALEDSDTTQPGFALFIPGPTDEAGQKPIDFIVISDNPALFRTEPVIDSSGTLAFSAARNANGSANVTVVVQDDGGSANGGVDYSAPKTFVITVAAVNDPPVVTLATNLVVAMRGSFLWTNFAFFEPGPRNESSQDLVGYTLFHTNMEFFSVQPVISNSGALAFTVASNSTGTITVRVVAQDDGGTMNGGEDKGSVSFTIAVAGAPPQVAPFLQGTRAAPGMLRLRVQGVSGDLLVTETSSDLIHWMVFNTNSILTEPLELNLPIESNIVRRFYRVQTIPGGAARPFDDER